MSGASREKDAADYDLERFTEMFDQALTSNDPRVKNALRQLMMMVILTDNDDHEGRARAKHGPLRRMQEDMRDQFRWIQRLEQDIETLKKQVSYNEMQQQGGGGTGYRAQDYNLKYAENSAGMAVDHNTYWNSVIAQKSSSAQIPDSSLRGLNIKIAADTGEK
jgi:hypothetical protein